MTQATSVLPSGVDVIIRMHDPERFVELDAALFSLFQQNFKPVHPIIVTQGFDDTAAARMRAAVALYDWDGQGHQQPDIVNVDAPKGVDIRTQLLNVGLERVRNRFLAFLDNDDYLYGHAYAYLTEEAIRSGAAIAFGEIVYKHVRVFSEFVHTARRIEPAFHDKGQRDLFIANFCPIHSFVVDRSRIDPDDLRFNPKLLRLEDYDFLLRICGKYPSTFQSRDKAVGIYNWHLDGRGSSVFGVVDTARREEHQRAWREAREHINKLKISLLGRRGGGNGRQPNRAEALVPFLSVALRVVRWGRVISHCLATPRKTARRAARRWAYNRSKPTLPLRNIPVDAAAPFLGRIDHIGDHKVCIGIVAYHAPPAELQRIITSARVALRRCGGLVRGEIRVLDHGGDLRAADLPADTILTRAANDGFGTGHNRCMKAAFDAGATVYIAANPDGAFHPNCVAHLLAMHEAQHESALIEARQFPEEHPKVYDPVTLTTPWVSGACLLIPKRIWEATSGFDPRIFLYCEDVDLSWSARALGFKTLICPPALFWHDVSDRPFDPRRWREMLLAGRYLACKWKDERFRAWTEGHLVSEHLVKDRDELPRCDDLPEVTGDAGVADFQHRFHFAPARW